MSLTAFDLKTALAARWEATGRGCCYFEITLPSPSGDLRPDVLAVEWRYSRLWVHAYEIKISRSDWLRDNKYERYRDYANTLTLVCPKGVIARDEPPEGIGVMWMDPETRQLRVRRQPDYRRDVDTTPVKDRVLRETIYRTSGRWMRFDRLRDYATMRKSMRGVGLMLATRMARRVETLEEKAETTHQRRTEAKAGLYDRLTRLLWDHGYRELPAWDDPADRADAAFAVLDKAMADTIPVALFAEETRRVMTLLQAMRRRFNITDDTKGSCE